MMNLAVLCERHERDEQLIEKYYLMAINNNPNDVIVLYNFADYYRNNKDYPNMIKYYKLAVEIGNDLPSMAILGSHYETMGDISNMRKYYFMAIKHGIFYADDKKDNDLSIDPFLFLKLLETATEEELEKSECLKNIQVVSSIYTDITVYKNKVNLFTKLNHIVECGICYENKLNIDLFCGHCVCTDCYTKVYDKKCPFCRITCVIPFTDDE
jgi:tetratricopeptide (TPR) repeat protein